MDPRERISDAEESFRTALDGILSTVWTALPCIVNSYDAEKQTVTLQPAILGQLRNPDGSVSSVRMPLLLDVPVMFLGGGGFTTTYPIGEGDEALAVFASRCIDSWWQSGGVQSQAELRMHDLSDAFAFVGVRSQPRRLSSVSVNSAQLRSDDGSVVVDVSGDRVKVSAPNVKVHAGVSYSWDVHGYGQKITWTGGSNYTIDNYTIGANITTNNHNIAPPEAP